ncbi:MAG: ribonuclease HII [Verrucomicrobia bacterium]|nr:ribonuclease HII [Verrucomicrobiota bacterium]
MHAFEVEARRCGYVRIAGVDEAGRGPLAGPVVAAACILPEGTEISGVNDSKSLSPSVRARLFQEIISHPLVEYGTGIVDASLIDQINILQATFRAMLLAISHLPQPPDYLLIDGNRMPRTQVPGQAIVRGDSRCYSIAAASILAKETRDALMNTYDSQWPEYGFAKHKGYGTREHLQAIEKYGPCPLHRISFEPLKSR